MFRTLTILSGAFCLSLATLHAEPLLEEKWAGESEGADVMRGGRWTMAQGLSSEMTLVRRVGSEGLFLQSNPSKGVPIALSVERFLLDPNGVELSIRFLRSEGAPDEEQLQFGFRGADSSGSPVLDSYRVRITADQVFVNRFPQARKGKQQIIGRYAIPGGLRAGDEEHVVSLRLVAISENECVINVTVDGVPAVNVTSRMGVSDGLPALGSTVRAFFFSGSGTLVREIKVEQPK